MPTMEELEAQARSMGLRLCERHLPDDMGLFDAPSHTIVLHDRLNQRQRLCTLQHEIIHAEHHRDGLMLLRADKEEALTRRETARRLIGVGDYARAELLCEGEPWAMACELGVTMGVLMDFRSLLRDGMATTASR